MRRIFHIDMDAFFVAVEQVREPSLRGKPVIVGGREWRGVVCSASYEARRWGIHAGMPLAQARRLCPQAIFVDGHFPQYQEASERFFAILSQFSPFIEPAGIDEAYLDMTGFESLYHSAQKAALLMKERIRRELGLIASVGIAGAKAVAKIASDQSKPNGLLEVPPGGEGAFLSPLPVKALIGVGPHTEDRLRLIGVNTIGQLSALSPSLLHSLFGAWGTLLHRLAHGIDPSPVRPPPEAKSISRSITLMEDTLDRAFLEAVLDRLGQRVGAELRRMGRVAGCIEVRVRYADFNTLQRQRRLTQPTDCHQLLFETGCHLLHQLLSLSREPVRLVGIGVSRLEAARQLPLWHNHVAKLEALNLALDRVRSQYGFSALQNGRAFALTPSHRGYLTLREEALTPWGGAGEKGKPGSKDREGTGASGDRSPCRVAPAERGIR